MARLVKHSGPNLIVLPLCSMYELGSNSDKPAGRFLLICFGVVRELLENHTLGYLIETNPIVFVFFWRKSPK